jgi:hypothetical protein
MVNYRELLVAPDGRQVTATSPAEYNDLLYGRGYRRADDVNQPAEPQRDTEADTGPDGVEEPEGSVREDDAPADE